VGGLDFSAQAVIGLVSVIAAKYMTVIGIVPACLLAIGASALVGLVNGVIVVKWTASAMLVTLGMQWVVSGITLLFSSEAIWGLPEEFKFLGSGRIAGLPVAIFVAALLFALSFVICNYTAFGKRLYAVGANMETARLSGISAKTVKAIAFILGPVYVAVGSLVLTSAVATGQPSLGGNLTIQSMMALFIAGMRMGGGNGNIVSITCGAIFITIMYNGMNLLNVPSDMQLVAGGLLLVLALCITSRK